jgi:UDP-N-acetylmuramoyl-tripeptide--D-alanyl-D-alanine ligase
MKPLLKQPVAALLAALARGIVRKYHPTIVMITGSVGKTSTKDAVAAALEQHFYLRKSEKSYNSEFGVPLTIIGSPNPWTSLPAWLRVFQEAFSLIMLPNHYPKLLVLEVGADRPGDLNRILKIATPDVVVVTRLPEVPVHVEAYASTKAVREEEFTPAYALAEAAPLILSADDAYALSMAKAIPATLSTFGTDTSAQVRVTNVGVFEEGGNVLGMSADLEIEGTTHTLTVRGAFGTSQLLAPAAAVATALALGLTPKQALKSLESYVPPPGRARILRGIQSTTLIDDSYNASPAAVEEALRSLSLLGNRRKVVVLGDMLELGRYSAQEHERIGTLAATTADVVIGVGTRARAIVTAAQAAGTPAESTRWFDTSAEASAALCELIREGDIVFVKGSQSIRTERIVETLLADQDDRRKLVRQESQWKAKR